MVSAWKCFSRQGFQATTMDEIIAETGMSSSSVYRYFASKDDLIASAAEESLTVTKGVLDDLKRREPLPGPRETLTAITKALKRQMDQPGYDLSKITVNAWAEALRQPQQEIARRLTGLGSALGSPWSQDEKLAALVAWLSLLN